jgi:NADH-quinone oxidoreductase subunit N
MINVVWVPTILIGGAFVVLGLDLLRARGKPKDLLEYVSYLTVLSAGLVLITQVWSDTPAEVGFKGSVVLDGLSKFLSVAVLAATGLGLMLAANLSNRFGADLPEVLALILISAAGMIFLAMSADLVTLFLSLEIMSLAVYVLTGCTRDARASEASIKYFIIGSLASAFLLYGMVLLYGASGSIRLADIGRATGGLQLVGLGLFLVGFAFKVGAAPFHMWVPDVYEGAPTAVTSFMSVAVKAAAFGAMARVVLQVRGGAADAAASLLEGAAIATMIVGNLFALGQPSVKRMLAYSSVAHAGYALMGIVVAAGASETLRRQGVSATSFYVLAYTFMTLGAFASLIYAASRRGDAEKLDDFRGMARGRPAAAFLMALFMVSLAGIPPTGGFFGKFTLFRVALEAGYTWLVITAILTTLLSVYYYLRVVVVMYMEPESEDADRATPDFTVGAAIWVAALFTLILGIFPSRFLSLASSLADKIQ